MSKHSILEAGPRPVSAKPEKPETAGKSALASPSAQIAAANALLAKPTDHNPAFADDGGGRSMAEMACADLDATLQLLADRAQYITGASGAAIALRRGEHHDMLCRASAGSNAPELGALLSMDHGLSGECVRTRQALRCDDAEGDARVNREVCRELGIASVVVMPIVSGESVLGVFELFSGKKAAFGERDLSTLTRLGQMVDTAVKYAAAAQDVRGILAESTVVQPAAGGGESDAGAEVGGAIAKSAAAGAVASPASTETMPAQRETKAAAAAPTSGDAGRAEVETSSKKTLFWSAALQAQESSDAQANPESPVVSGFKNLQKCQACAFPISQGRELCVDCEEKKWKGQTPAKPVIDPTTPSSAQSSSARANQEAPPQSSARETKPASLPVEDAAAHNRLDESDPHNSNEAPGAAAALTPLPAEPEELVVPAALKSSLDRKEPAIASPAVAATAPVSHSTWEAPAPDDSNLFSSALPPESWITQNRYVLVTVLIVAVVAAVLWLR